MKKRRPPAELNDESMLYFSLKQEASHIFMLYPRLGILALLTVDEQGTPRGARLEQFSSQEVSLLRPLLANYPFYCPYEVLFASFYTGSFEEKSIARARERLQEALDYGAWDNEMRPIRNVLSHVRLKLERWGIRILSILETGYQLEYNPVDPPTPRPRKD